MTRPIEGEVVEGRNSARVIRSILEVLIVITYAGIAPGKLLNVESRENIEKKTSQSVPMLNNGPNLETDHIALGAPNKNIALSEVSADWRAY